MPGSPQAHDVPTPRGESQTPWRWIWIIASAALATHLHVLWGGWVRDDYALILSNPAIRTLQSIPSQFQSPFLGIFWRPSVTISYTLEYAMWGLRPAGFHATNLVLFTVASVLVSRVWFLLTQNQALAGFAGLLFAVHGAHYQPAVIADRTGLLCTTALLAAWWCALRISTATHVAKKAVWAILGAGAFCVSLGAKEEAVVLPVLIVLGAVFPPNARSKVRALLPIAAVYGGVACLYVILRGRVLGGESLLAAAAPGVGERILSMPSWLAHHWLTAAIPLRLDIDYRGLVWPHASTFAVAVGWCVVVLVFAAAVRGRRTYPAVLLGLTMGLVAWLPTSNLIPIYPETASSLVFMPPHFLLLQNVGYCGVLAAGVVGLMTWARALGVILTAAYLCMHAAVTVRMNYIWSDDLRLYSYVTDMHPSHPLMLRNLGLALLNRGEYGEAADAYRRSLAAEPSAESYNGLGVTLRALGQDAQSLDAFMAALELAPSHTNARVNGADLLVAQDRLDEALALLHEGSTIADDAVAVADKRAMLLRDAGRAGEARSVLLNAIERVPSDARLWNTMGTVHAEMGDLSAARDAWRRAEALAPGMTPAAQNLATFQSGAR